WVCTDDLSTNPYIAVNRVGETVYLYSRTEGRRATIVNSKGPEMHRVIGSKTDLAPVLGITRHTAGNEVSELAIAAGQFVCVNTEDDVHVQGGDAPESGLPGTAG